MDQKIIFLKIVEITSKEGKKYFKIKFLTEDFEYHEQFITSDLVQKILNLKLQPLTVYKSKFLIDKDMKLHISDIN